MSDTFMRNVFKHIECVEYVLQVIMGRNDLHVVDSVVQKDYKNLQGRSAILDCAAGMPKIKDMMLRFSRRTRERRPGGRGITAVLLI